MKKMQGENKIIETNVPPHEIYRSGKDKDNFKNNINHNYWNCVYSEFGQMPFHHCVAIRPLNNKGSSQCNHMDAGIMIYA